MDPVVRIIDGSVTAPLGFKAAGVAAGVRKSGRRDVMLLASDTTAAAAAVFTRNAVAAAPVVVSREVVADGALRAVVVNAGNANACTGAQGLLDARAMCERAAALLGVAADEVAVAQTGVIGVPLPTPIVLAGIDAAAAALTADGGAAAAEAIMTTDTFAKEAAATVEVDGVVYSVGGMAKGSGMIKPDMATMLAFITTDAPLTAAAADAALRGAVSRTFNRITVDSDTSTNDSVFLLANGAAGGASIEPGTPAFAALAEAIADVAGRLARMIVRDGEGATKLVAVTVSGAASEADAVAVAFSIADSPLFKTAIFGRDANWGRVAMAVGKSGATVDPDRLEIRFAGILTCVDGGAVPFSEEEALEALSADEVTVDVDLHLGEGAATVWTCDLSYDYVRINADYRT
jgi:glutamate N-acetyltransferase/amino-acid N-acetyltransferase